MGCTASRVDVYNPLFQSTCPICFEDSWDPPLRCNHVFHAQCLHLWKLQCKKNKWKYTCPMCRAPIY